MVFREDRNDFYRIFVSASTKDVEKYLSCSLNYSSFEHREEKPFFYCSNAEFYRNGIENMIEKGILKKVHREELHKLNEYLNRENPNKVYCANKLDDLKSLV